MQTKICCAVYDVVSQLVIQRARDRNLLAFFTGDDISRISSQSDLEALPAGLGKMCPPNDLHFRRRIATTHGRADAFQSRNYTLNTPSTHSQANQRRQRFKNIRRKRGQARAKQQPGVTISGETDAAATIGYGKSRGH